MNFSFRLTFVPISQVAANLSGSWNNFLFSHIFPSFFSNQPSKMLNWMLKVTLYDARLKNKAFYCSNIVQKVTEFYKDWNKLKLFYCQFANFDYLISGHLFPNLHYKGATRTKSTRRFNCNLQFTQSFFIGSHVWNWFNFWSKSNRFLCSTIRGFLIKDSKWYTSD